MDNITEPITEKRKSPFYYYLGAFLVAFALLLFALIFTFELLYGRNEKLYKVVMCVFTLLVFTSVFYYTRKALYRYQHKRVEYFVIGILRFVTSSVMLGYSFTKLSNGHMYASYAALDTRLTDLNDFETVWSFYGRYSSLQILLGLAELVPALLLLFRRTTFIGAVMMWPVVANVVLLNTYFEIGGLTLPVSMLILVFTTYILYSHAAGILYFLNRMAVEDTGPVPIKPFLRKTMDVVKFVPLALLLAVGILRLIKPHHTLPLKGAYELSEVKINNRLFPHDSLPPDIYRKIYFEKRRLQSAVINAEGFVRAYVEFLPGDSLNIAYRRGPLDGFVIPDSVGRFSGVYVSPSTDDLLLKGKQSSLNIEAKYRRLPLREFNYWWE
jgi:hypothetical protein